MKITSSDVDDLLDRVNETHKRLRNLLSPSAEDELKLAMIARHNGLAIQTSDSFSMIMEDSPVYQADLHSLVLEDTRYNKLWAQYKKAYKLDRDNLPSASLAWFRLRIMIRRYLGLYQQNVDEIWAKVYEDRVLRILDR